ncbi:MAG: sigma-70 family RNA polymerase sigma factor [bacterium]
MTDAELINRFLDGDINSFNRLVKRWEKPIYNFIYRNLSNKNSAKDVCQKTFIRVYMKLKKLKDPHKFSPWIYRIALNLCRDEHRNNKKRNHLSCDQTNEEQHYIPVQLPANDDNSPDKILNKKQIENLLKEQLQKIPEEQRVVIIMKQYQGLKFREIADILGQPVNTVKSRLYYGLKALKDNFKKAELTKEVFFHEM